MSAVTRVKRTSIPQIRDRKGKEPIVCLTAYTTQMARRLDPHVDLLLVGDLLGMVLYGFDSTLPVTLEMMIAHGAAVMRGAERACVIVDLPFGSYQESPEQAFRSAARVMAETGASGVKLEGGVEMVPAVRFLTQRGIPVCAHVGLMPQAVNTAGGFKATGGSGRRSAADHPRCAVHGRGGRLEAAGGIHGLRHQADMSADGDAALRQEAHCGHHLHAALELHAAGAGFRHHPRGAAEGLLGTFLIAAEKGRSTMTQARSAPRITARRGVGRCRHLSSVTGSVLSKP